jgi:putative transposase
MVVMDQYTRRIVGITVHAGPLDGPSICRMFGRIVTRTSVVPRSLSSDHDPLFQFHRWKANLRILEIQEIKTVPDVPLSHPFVERLIGTIRREFLDHVPFWTSTDLERKLESFRDYYNEARPHRSLDGGTPISRQQAPRTPGSIGWQRYCAGFTSCRSRLSQEFAPNTSEGRQERFFAELKEAYNFCFQHDKEWPISVERQRPAARTSRPRGPG